MSLDYEIVKDLPERVINELAVLEDRARRAEIALRRERRRVAELRDEVALLRTVVTEVQALAAELQERAQQIASDATEAAAAVEGRLRHLLVVQDPARQNTV